MADPATTTTTPQNIFDTIVANSHSLQDAMGNLAHFLSDQVTKYGPDAVNLFLDVIRIQSLGTIALGLILGVALPIVHYKVAKHLVKKFWDPYFGVGLACALTGIPTAIAAGTAWVKCLFNIWAWVGIFNPALSLAGHLYTHFLSF